MRNRWALLVVVFLGLTPSRVGSQSAGSIELLEVALWPEYDRQAVLAIYGFRLKPGSLPPITLAIPIPTAVGQPHAVAWRDERGELMVAEFNRVVEDERTMMLITMPSLQGQLEFYADLTIEGNRRTFEFSWPGGVDVSNFSYKVQEPVGARGLEITPSPDRRTVGQDGFTYHWVDVGPVEASEKPTIELSYEKESAALSSPEPSQPSIPSTAARQESTDEDTPLHWLLGSFVGVLLGVAIGWYWRSSQKPPVASSSAPAHQKARTKPPKKKDAGKTAASFCHNCGKKAVIGATFCMSCGTRLRT